MKTSLEMKSKIEGGITVELVEADYLEDLNKIFNTIRNQYNRPGFRNGKVPYSLIYNLYGYKTLCDCCVEKALNAVSDFINKDENLKDLTLMQPLIKALNFPNKNEVDYKHPGDVSFSYIYATVPTINIDDIENRCKKIEIEEKIAGEINDNDVENVVERFKKKITKFINVNKVTESSNIVFLKNSEQKTSDENLFFPAQGCSIDGNIIDLMGLSVGSEIELEIKDVLSLVIPWSFASYFEECIILTRLREGKQKLVITSIRSLDKKEITDEELFQQFKDDISAESLPAFNDINEYKKAVRKSLSLYMTCLFDRILRTTVRESLIKIYDKDIFISEEYLKRSMSNFENNKLYKQFLLNNIKWGCIREAILKKFEITLTEEDMVNLNEAYELSRNNEVKNLEKCIDYGSFLGISDNIKKKDFMIDCKLTQRILQMCEVKTKVFDFADFAKFLKIKILENLAKYKNYELQK
ncbi:MAG: hypothetical protein LBD32_01055 [Cytophagales bacterium]|jgi:hypothetical protein|nr:hypothetical protein [Cytophagales bacterium]